MSDYTTTEAAELLGKNRETVRRWAAAGHIDGARKIGRDWKLPQDEIERIHREGLDFDALAETAEA